MDLDEKTGVLTIDVTDEIWNSLHMGSATIFGFLIGVGVMIIWP